MSRQTGYSFCKPLAMTRLSRALALVGLLCGTLFSGPVAVAARDTSVKSLHAKRLEAVKRWELSARGRDSGGNARRATGPAPPRVKNITFSNPKASGEYATAMLFPIVPSHSLLEYYVDGTTIPKVHFDVGPSWSGLIPISSSPHETRKVWL
jgi:carboxypeptidase D